MVPSATSFNHQIFRFVIFRFEEFNDLTQEFCDVFRLRSPKSAYAVWWFQFKIAHDFKSWSVVYRLGLVTKFKSVVLMNAGL